MRTFILAAVSLALGVVSMARVITFDDLYNVPRYGDMQISADGEKIVFTLTQNDLKKESSTTHIWIMNRDGSAAGQLTNGPTGERRPRWSPDGRTLYFLSSRDEDKTQIWRLPLSGGEAVAVTDIATGVSAFEVDPAGKNFIIVSSVYPDCHSDSCNRDRMGAAENDPIEAKLYDRLLFRHYNRWDNGRVSRLFLADVESGAHRELYSGPYNAPTVLLGGGGDYGFSPDGQEVCFVMCTDSTPAIWPNNDLYIIPTKGGGQARRITENKGLDVSPRYSPDGRYIAYLSMAREGYESDQQDLTLYDRAKGTHTNLTGDFDRSIWDYEWDSKSRYIYFSAAEYGLVKIWRLDIKSRRIEKLLDDAVYGDRRLSPDDKYLIVSRSLSNQPYELYQFDLGSRKLTQLTHFTEKVTADLDMNRAEEFWFEGFAGDSIHGFLTLPPNFDATATYPLVLLIHGGPQYCWLGDFNYYGWNTQLTVAQGYVVAQIDPHGSVGYGLKFKEYVSGNWGRGDYEDLMTGVDYLIANHPYIDTTRMAALGRSYGGFMTNWICGHTDRFDCLITVDGTYEHISEYGSTEELWFPEWECKGTPWSNREEYVRSSPETYAADFKTPTMVIHGGRDYRVDLSQGLQMFTALQRMGVPSQLLYFPDEGHSVGKLKNLRYVYDEQFRWLKRWLKR